MENIRLQFHSEDSNSSSKEVIHIPIECDVDWMSDGSSPQNKKSWIVHFKSNKNCNEGYVESLQSLQDLLMSYEYETKSKFVSYSKSKNFGKDLSDESMKEEFVKNPPRIFRVKRVNEQWVDKNIPYCGIGTRTLICRFGPRTYNKNTVKTPPPKTTATRNRTSRKQGCLAKIKISHRICFPEYELHASAKSRDKKESTVKLQKDFASGKNIKCINEFHISLPPVTAHMNHVVGENACTNLPMDPRLKEYLKNLVTVDNISEVSELKIRLEEYMKHSLFSGCEFPAKTNTAFWPTSQQIRNFVRDYSVKNRLKDIGTDNTVPESLPGHDSQKSAIDEQCNSLKDKLRANIDELKTALFLPNNSDTLKILTWVETTTGQAMKECKGFLPRQKKKKIGKQNGVPKVKKATTPKKLKVPPPPPPLPPSPNIQNVQNRMMYQYDKVPNPTPGYSTITQMQNFHNVQFQNPGYFPQYQH